MQINSNTPEGNFFLIPLIIKPGHGKSACLIMFDGNQLEKPRKTDVYRQGRTNGIHFEVDLPHLLRTPPIGERLVGAPDFKKVTVTPYFNMISPDLIIFFESN